MYKQRITMLVLLIAFLFQGSLFAQKTYEYESFENDPMDVRIYTLDNGLKVYLSPNDLEPRIQTYVAIKVGSKHDPAETTGLAHYFEHLMFKGTSTFGTIDWEKEKPLLDQIRLLYEAYRAETDKKKRDAIYSRIDSISYIASTYAIPNEYDRLMTAIGSTGTNAGTSNDYTYYLENIPSNQLENWAMIQGIRFSDPVIRLFHTELETVYEEYNMSQTNDKRMVFQAMNEALYPRHPYAQQTTLGDPEQLKNPSIVNIERFYEQYYVPNNMAVIMAGDFDPDEAIRVIDKHFGHLEPRELPPFSFEPEPPISEPVIKKVEGLASEYVQIGFRFEGAGSEQLPYLELMSNVLGNGRAGLVDQNLNKQQAARGTSATTMTLGDYSVLNLFGRNKDGQTLDEVKELLLEQVEILKSGNWPDWMLEAGVNNIRLALERRVESNNSRARDLSMNFLMDVPYQQTLDFSEKLASITKEEIIAFANKHLRDNNYAVVYKLQAETLDVEQVEKPSITPIHINRDAKSDLLIQVQNTEVPPIEPEFVNFDEDMVRIFLPNGTELLYVQDKTSPSFNLAFEWDMGSNHNLYLPYISSYYNVVGTKHRSVEDVSNQFYILAGGYSLRSTGNNTRLAIRGIKDNLEKTIQLTQEALWEPEINDAALKQQITNIKTSRRNNRNDQQSLLKALENYATYGPKNPSTYNLTNEQLDQITAQQLVDLLTELHQYEHKVLYFGPHNLQEVIKMVAKYHRVPADLKPTPDEIRFEPLDTKEEKVYFAHFDASQSYLQTVSKGERYQEELLPVITLYNRYFAGGMNAIVFQELREKRGLAYMATSRFNVPGRPDEHYLNTSLIATQNDKVIEAFSAFNELFDEIPLSESAFRLAQEQNISNMRTERIRAGNIINQYLRARIMGETEDVRRILFEEMPKITMNDIKAFNHQHIRNQPKTYIILGNENMVDFEAVEKHFGPVIRLTADELFAF
jgi:predicted Zn-dependent peptidase